MAPRNALVLLFPGFNTLDMNGPVETLHSPQRGQIFKVTIASETDITSSAEGVQVKRHIPLDRDLIAAVSDYDVLVVPGGPGPYIEEQAAKTSEPFLDLIAAFASVQSTQERPKTLLSICSGAVFLATLGIFNGLHCTTHWSHFEPLKKHAEAAAAKSSEGPSSMAKILAARFVDSGLNSSGVRIVSSGGVSCGIDAALHLVKLYAGEEMAKTAAANLDYAWKKTEGVVFL